ncbi:MAG: hypothetical protein NTV01_03390 [Bacteroidia bacterium]|nr:hypothetical protein [Bacteroidia bacterium]
MTSIEIKYRPIPWLKYTRRILCSHPDDWEELTPAQFISAACVFKETISDDNLIASMLNIRKRIVRKLSPYQKLRIIELLRFLETFRPCFEFILPRIAGYKAPKPRLKDETFGCFIFAETYFERYASTSEPEFLSKFIACFYRDGPFKESDITGRAGIIAKQPLITQEAIYINYILIREWYTLEYPLVFKPAADQSEKEKSSWLDVYDILLGDDIVKEEEYANLPISTVLRYLNKKIKQDRHESKVR